MKTRHWVLLFILSSLANIGYMAALDDTFNVGDGIFSPVYWILSLGTYVYLWAIVDNHVEFD